MTAAAIHSNGTLPSPITLAIASTHPPKPPITKPVETHCHIHWRCWRCRTASTLTRIFSIVLLQSGNRFRLAVSIWYRQTEPRLNQHFVELLRKVTVYLTVLTNSSTVSQKCNASCHQDRCIASFGNCGIRYLNSPVTHFAPIPDSIYS